MILYFASCEYLKWQLVELEVERETDNAYHFKIDRMCRRKYVEKVNVDKPIMGQGKGIFSTKELAKQAMLNWIDKEMDKIEKRQSELERLEDEINETI